MSRLDELIAELCPDGVENKTLNEVCNISAGGDVPKASMSKEMTQEFTVPIISNGIGENAFYGYTDTAKITVPAVTIAARGTIGYAEYRDYPYFPIVRLLSAIPKDTSVLNTRFLYFCLQGKNYKVPTSGIPQLTAPELKKVEIPVPPLEVQSEIVRILDNFTELTARKQQYEYYKELVFEKYITEETVFGSLNNITDVRDGTHDSPKPSNVGKYLITSKNVKNGTINFDGSYLISEEDFISINARSKVDKWDLLFTMIGTVGEVGLVTDEPDYAIKNVGLIKTNSEILARFLYFFLTTKRVKKYIEDNRSKGSQVFLALGKLRNLPVPKLSEEEMKQIIAIISRFDKLCFDISEGLPAEIEARQKQYEYYRDKLLTFKQLA